MSSKMRILIAVVAVLTLPAIPVLAQEEQPIGKQDIPAAVLKAFHESYPGIEITGYDREVDEGRTLYEIETRAGDFDRDYVYLEDGALFQVEEGVPVNSLPKAVVDAVMKAHPGCEIDEAEKITRGETVEYEVVAEVGEKEFELLMSSDGTLLASEQIDEDEDEGHDDDDEDESD